MDEQSRRTNILVGNEVLTQIDDSQNVTHANGVMTIAVNKLTPTVQLGTYCLYWNNGVLTAYPATGGEARAFAMKADLDALAATIPAAVTWENLSDKPATFPTTWNQVADKPDLSTSKVYFSVDFPGTLSPQSKDIQLPNSPNTISLVYFTYGFYGETPAATVEADIQQWNWDTSIWESIVTPTGKDVFIRTGDGHKTTSVHIPSAVQVGRMNCASTNQFYSTDVVRVAILNASGGAINAHFVLEMEMTY